MISLSDITNQYGTYSGNSLRGPLGSIGSVRNDGLEGISGVNYPYLNGIIVKINGAAYTDSGYLNALKPELVIMLPFFLMFKSSWFSQPFRNLFLAQSIDSRA